MAAPGGATCAVRSRGVARAPFVRWFVRAARAGASVGWLVLSGACSSRGAREREVADGGWADAPVDSPVGATFGGTGCAACLEQVCGASFSACRDEPECAHLLECWLGCPPGADGLADPGCTAACAKGDSSAATRAEDALSACSSDGPGAACTACRDAGGVAAILHEDCPSADAEGRSCDHLPAVCCRTYDACAGDPGCAALSSCFAGCPGDDRLVDAGDGGGFFPSCDEACIAQHPGAVAIYVPLMMCTNLNDLATTGCADVYNPCQECEGLRCAAQFIDAYEAPGGFGLSNCLATCGQDNDCFIGCFAAFPGAARAVDAFAACAANLCAMPCTGYASN